MCSQLLLPFLNLIGSRGAGTLISEEGDSASDPGEWECNRDRSAGARNIANRSLPLPEQIASVGEVALKGNTVTGNKKEKASPFPVQSQGLLLLGATSIPFSYSPQFP